MGLESDMASEERVRAALNWMREQAPGLEWTEDDASFFLAEFDTRCQQSKTTTSGQETATMVLRWAQAWKWAELDDAEQSQQPDLQRDEWWAWNRVRESADDETRRSQVEEARRAEADALERTRAEALRAKEQRLLAMTPEERARGEKRRQARAEARRARNEAKRRAEDEARLAEEARRAEDEARLAEAKRWAMEEARLAREEARRAREWAKKRAMAHARESEAAVTEWKAARRNIEEEARRADEQRRLTQTPEDRKRMTELERAEEKARREAQENRPPWAESDYSD